MVQTLTAKSIGIVQVWNEEEQDLQDELVRGGGIQEGLHVEGARGLGARPMPDPVGVHLLQTHVLRSGSKACHDVCLLGCTQSKISIANFFLPLMTHAMFREVKCTRWGLPLHAKLEFRLMLICKNYFCQKWLMLMLCSRS